MKNILKELPQKNLSGRLKFTTENFIDTHDISGKKILNIGCGYGWFEFWAAKNKVGKIIGIEIDDKNLETARSLSDKRIQFAIGDAIKIPLKNKTFDTVTSWEVLEHIPKNTEIQMFCEANRVLKSKGVFYISTPNSTFWSKVLDPAWWLIGHRHYSIKDIKYYAINSGFIVKKIEIKGGWWEMLSMLNLYFSKWVLRRKPLFFKWFERNKNIEYKKHGWSNIFVKMEKS